MQNARYHVEASTAMSNNPSNKSNYQFWEILFCKSTIFAPQKNDNFLCQYFRLGYLILYYVGNEFGVYQLSIRNVNII